MLIKVNALKGQTRPSIESYILTTISRLDSRWALDNVTDVHFFRKDLDQKLQNSLPFPVHVNINETLHEVPVTHNESITMLEMVMPEPLGSPTLPLQHFTILYFHGGGFVEGSIEGYRGVVANLVFELQQVLNRNSSTRFHLTALIPEYRLAPEHQLPVPIDDCVASYQYMLNLEGVDPSSVIFMGDSAGGHLVISTTLGIVERGLPLPYKLVAFSPWTDLTMSLPSIQQNEGKDPFLTRSVLQKFANWAAPTKEIQEKYSVLLEPNENFASFPPLLMFVGTDEILLDDVLQMAKKLSNLHAEVRLNVVKDQIHVFNLMVGWLPEAVDALFNAKNFLIA